MYNTTSGLVGRPVRVSHEGYGAGADHTHAAARHTQPSGVSAGRVRAPQVGHAVGAPSRISWVASAESCGDPRRERPRRPDKLSDVMESPVNG